LLPCLSRLLIANKSRRVRLLRIKIALKLLIFWHILVTLVIWPPLVVLISVVLVASVVVVVLEVLSLITTGGIGGLLSISFGDKSLGVVIGWVELLLNSVEVVKVVF
jgi:hypothetical protein